MQPKGLLHISMKIRQFPMHRSHAQVGFPARHEHPTPGPGLGVKETLAQARSLNNQPGKRGEFTLALKQPTLRSSPS